MVVAGEDATLWHNRFRPRAEDLVSFERDVLPLFVNQCAPCHSGPDPPRGLSLDADHAYAETVFASSRERANMPRVTPLNLDRSYLFHKVSGTHLEAGGSGDRMPPGGALTQEEIATLRAWIAQGALNN
jgi:hypothetical protein